MEMINDLYKDGNLINRMYEGNMPINKAYKDGVVIYQGVNTPTPPQPTGYTAQYLTFEIVSAGTIEWRASSTAVTKTISYSLDDGTTWTSITSATGTSAPSIDVEVGDKVLFKGDNSSYGGGILDYNRFRGTAKFNAQGNIMSLIDSQNFASLTTLLSATTFLHLFYASNIIDASNLILPATTLTQDCYQYMFSYCTGLTSAPALPATTLAQSCYNGMFNLCTSLTSAPALPATSLANYCYYNMFEGCSSLISAPALPATNLAQGCYNGMFNLCTSLVNAPALPANVLSRYCYVEMFSGCTSLTSAPVLSATTLATDCYRAMFNGCTSLNYIECLATDISAPNCTTDWVNGVSSSGTFYKASGVTWPSGTDGIPDKWTVIEL